MKNIKRILALVIVAMMLVAIAIIPASASEIQPRAETCPKCGSMTTVTISAWKLSRTYYVNCVHGGSGYDTIRDYYKEATVKCSCGKYSRTYVYDTKTTNTCGG